MGKKTNSAQTNRTVRHGEPILTELADAKAGFAILSPADGKLIPMEEVPDPVFSSGTLGKCLGILPDNGIIYAPCDGIVSGVEQTGHALGIETVNGRAVLVHAGLDTVTLGGKGFTVVVREGSTVSAGDVVMKVDLDKITEAGLSPIVIITCSE